MSEKQIVVPDGMIQAARAALKARYHDVSEGQILDACMVLVTAVQWLHDNPIVPTVDQWSDIYHNSDARSARWRCVEWQRRMFLAPEPEVPEEIEDLILKNVQDGDTCLAVNSNARVMEAYTIGLLKGRAK